MGRQFNEFSSERRERQTKRKRECNRIILYNIDYIINRNLIQKESGASKKTVEDRVGDTVQEVRCSS